MARAVYAPITILKLRDPEGGGWVTTGTLEEGSKLVPSAIKIGLNGDKRLVGLNIVITGIDFEASEDYREKFQRLVNKKLYAAVLNESGGCILGPFSYIFYQEALEKRGMRWIHELNGKARTIKWFTYLDEGWAQFKSDAGID